MTKNYFLQLATYNIQANNIVHGWLESIDDKQWNREVISSFNSIKDTAIHVLSAENIWHERFTGVTPPTWLAKDFSGDKKTVIARWKQASNDLLKYIESLDDEALSQQFAYTRLNGDAFTKSLYNVVAHVFNHSSYHRGQLVTMLRQVGFVDVSSLDYLTFSK